MTSVSAGHIILTQTQPVGSGRSQRESNPTSPHQESHALPTELPRLPPPCVIKKREQQRRFKRREETEKKSKKGEKEEARMDNRKDGGNKREETR